MYVIFYLVSDNCVLILLVKVGFYYLIWLINCYKEEGGKLGNVNFCLVNYFLIRVNINYVFCCGYWEK